MKRRIGKAKTSSRVYVRIRRILESARTTAARSVNTVQVVANWLVGREIVEEEQKGKKKAGYGETLLAELAKLLTADYGSGYSATNLRWFRQFYLEYSSLLSGRIYHAVRDEFTDGQSEDDDQIHHALSDESNKEKSVRKFWKPGQLHPNMSWTHYRTLLRVDKTGARAFYEIEAVKNNWAARELERQINSLLFERLSRSRDKMGLMRLAVKGHVVQKPVDVFKDPVVMEFLGLPESPKLVESELEQALIEHLKAFLLELGKGFAFVARQERLTLDGDHFYIDLVFYHTVLKCYVLIDLKTGKLTHQDLGQLQLYVNYYDRERRTVGDNPTLGLILCADKNDAVVQYTLGKDQRKTIFASRYKLHLPSVSELQTELRREVRALAAPTKKEGVS